MGTTSFSIVLGNATLRSCECVCLNRDVGEFVKQRETIEVETPRDQPNTFPTQPRDLFNIRPKMIIENRGADLNVFEKV